MANPVVSVLTTCYNRADYVAETIESVLAQSFEDFEYIIVDDGSTDGSFDVICDYAKKDSRIQAYQNESNLGDYPNRNKAASYASGTYLKYIDSDDVLYPHALDVCVRYMDMFPNAGLGLTKWHSQERPLPELLGPFECYQRHFLEGGLFSNAPGSVVIRRSSFEETGNFSGVRMIGDFEMWLKMARMFDVALLPGFIHWDRKHEKQESNFDEMDYAVLRLDVCRDALSQENCPLSQSDSEKAETLMRKSAARLGVYGLRRFAFGRVFRFARKSRCGIAGIAREFFSLRPRISFPAR